jgi:hypothetical protein
MLSARILRKFSSRSAQYGGLIAWKNFPNDLRGTEDASMRHNGKPGAMTVVQNDFPNNQGIGLAVGALPALRSIFPANSRSSGTASRSEQSTAEDLFRVDRHSTTIPKLEVFHNDQ